LIRIQQSIEVERQRFIRGIRNDTQRCRRQPFLRADCPDPPRLHLNRIRTTPLPQRLLFRGRNGDVLGTKEHPAASSGSSQGQGQRETIVGVAKQSPWTEDGIQSTREPAGEHHTWPPPFQPGFQRAFGIAPPHAGDQDLYADE
jgi:hypothetical protein